MCSPTDRRRHACFMATVAVSALVHLVVLDAAADLSALEQLRVASLPTGPRAGIVAAAAVVVAFAAVGYRHNARWPRASTDARAALPAELARWLGVLVVAAAGALLLLPAPAAGAAAALGAGTWVACRLGARWQVPVELLPDPAPGQVWWAMVPFEDRVGSKDRPALVVSRSRRAATVLMFTSQDKSGRAGYVSVPPSVWRVPRRSFLRTDRRIRVRLENFRRFETDVDVATLAALGLDR